VHVPVYIGIGGVTPLILNTVWGEWSVSHTGLFMLGESAPLDLFNWRLGVLQSQCGHFEEEQNAPCRECNHDSLTVQHVSGIVIT